MRRSNTPPAPNKRFDFVCSLGGTVAVLAVTGSKNFPSSTNAALDKASGSTTWISSEAFVVCKQRHIVVWRKFAGSVAHFRSLQGWSQGGEPACHEVHGRFFKETITSAPPATCQMGPPFEPKPTKASDTRGPSSPPPKTWQYGASFRL